MDSDQQPGPVSLEPGFRSTLFTDDVGIAELFVVGHAKVDYCRIAIHADYELSRTLFIEEAVERRSSPGAAISNNVESTKQVKERGLRAPVQRFVRRRVISF